MSHERVCELAGESTCRKRVTVCLIYDFWGNLVGSASNRCSPPDGECTRMVRSDGQAAYPSSSTCNWEHAEQRAVASVLPGTIPVRAVLYGHDFPCPDCEAALNNVGVRRIDVVPDGLGTGLRPAPRQEMPQP